MIIKYKNKYWALCFFFLILIPSYSFAQKIYASVNIKGVGKLSGDVKTSGHQGKIEIIDYSIDFKDIGLKTAKGSISIQKPMDGASLPLMNAYVNQQILNSLVLEIFMLEETRPSFELSIENAKILNINYKHDKKTKKSKEAITISFTHYKMSNTSKKQNIEFDIQKIN